MWSVDQQQYAASNWDVIRKTQSQTLTQTYWSEFALSPNSLLGNLNASNIREGRWLTLLLEFLWDPPISGKPHWSDSARGEHIDAFMITGKAWIAPLPLLSTPLIRKRQLQQLWLALSLTWKWSMPTLEARVAKMPVPDDRSSENNFLNYDTIP